MKELTDEQQVVKVFLAHLKQSHEMAVLAIELAEQQTGVCRQDMAKALLESGNVLVWAGEALKEG